MAIFNEMLGGGVNAKDCNATAADILSGKTAAVGKNIVTGTMTNNGAVSKSLNAGASYTIPKGYHNGSGKVTANSLASQNAVAPKGKIATMIVADGETINTGDPISFKSGTLVDCTEISTTIASNPIMAVKEIDNNRILMAHRNSANIICTIYNVSDTGITKVGSDKTVITDCSGYISLIYLKNGKCLLVYVSSGTLKACIITISGTTITATSAQTITSALSTTGTILKEMVEYEDNKVLLGHLSGTTVCVVALQVSTSSITTLFSKSVDAATLGETNYSSCSSDGKGEIIKLSNSQYCACFKYTNENRNHYLHCLPFTLNGTNITFSTTFCYSAVSGNHSKTIALNNNTLMVARVSDTTATSIVYFHIKDNVATRFMASSVDTSGYANNVNIEKMNDQDYFLWTDSYSSFGMKHGLTYDSAETDIPSFKMGTNAVLYCMKNGTLIGLTVYTKNELRYFIKTQSKISAGFSGTARGIALANGNSGDAINVALF